MDSPRGRKERKEPVSTNVTERYREWAAGRGGGKVGQLNFKLGNGNYEQNHQTSTNERIKAWTVKGEGSTVKKRPFLAQLL